MTTITKPGEADLTRAAILTMAWDVFANKLHPVKMANILTERIASLGTAPATPVPASEPVSWQVRRTDGSPLACWESCTKDLYDLTLSNGRYCGFENGPPCEVRALGVIDAPTSPALAPATQADAAGAGQEAAAVQAVGAWQDIATAPKGEVVLVYTPPQAGDWPDQVRIDFDCIGPDYEGWTAHSECYEHYMAVGGSRAAGPDVECVGPAQEAPYTHWMPLPAPPAALCPPVGGGDTP